jgi:hypothetical protein
MKNKGSQRIFFNGREGLGMTPNITVNCEKLSIFIVNTALDGEPHPVSEVPVEPANDECLNNHSDCGCTVSDR